MNRDQQIKSIINECTHSNNLFDLLNDLRQDVNYEFENKQSKLFEMEEQANSSSEKMRIDFYNSDIYEEYSYRVQELKTFVDVIDDIQNHLDKAFEKITFDLEDVCCEEE